MRSSTESNAAFAPRGRNIHEPDEHPALKGSFVFVPTAGMRLGPETLVLELFREVFFERFAEETRERQLSPDSGLTQSSYSRGEMAVLYAVRGRRRKPRGRRDPGRPLYAPAYPCVARHAWLRRRSDRVVRDFLLAGPVRQYLHSTSNPLRLDAAELAPQLLKALQGHHAATPSDYQQSDILSVALKDVDFPLDVEASRGRLIDLFGANSREGPRPFRADQPDDLARTITRDLASICELERDLARIQWLPVLKTFLRLSTASWLLAHMRVTVLIRDWLVNALAGGPIPNDREVTSSIAARNLGLLHPTDAPTREVKQHVEDYMRARVELRVLLPLVDGLSRDGVLRNKVVTLSSRASDQVTVADLVNTVRALRAQFVSTHGGADHLAPRQILTRRCEQFPAWKDPLHKGQGENLDEFLRVLRRSGEGDGDEGYLLTPVQQERRQAFRVFPGPLLLETMVYLTERAKRSPGGAPGKLILSDVEARFRDYGIDFAASAGARPRLIVRLQELSLLKGSPDASDSAEVVPPFGTSRTRES